MPDETTIQKFTNEHLGASIRVVDHNGEPWFVAKDIALTLGYTNPRKAIRDHCKGVNETFLPSDGGSQTMKIIPESDVYRLILRSKLPQAEAFQDWVVGEVLPSIRKHGAYMTDEVLNRAISDPRFMSEVLASLADERERNQALEEKLDYLKPAIPFGTPSKANGLPREELVKPYWRARWRRVKTITEVTEWQRSLFE